MSPQGTSFTPLLIVVAIAFTVPLLLSRLRRFGIPIVVGEIIAGIVVGQSGLGLIEESFLLRVLSELGFAYLMFLSGLEIDFSAMRATGVPGAASRARKVLGNPFTIAHLVFALTLAGSLVAGLVLSGQGLVRDPWIVALILATTSLGVVVPVLKENGLADSSYGQLLLLTSLVADFGSIVLISVYVVLRGEGPTVEVMLILVLLAAFFASYRLLAAFREHLPLDRFIARLSSATSQIRTRGSIALALLFIGLAETLGVEIILGAFLAGVIVSSLSRGSSTLLREKLDAIGYGFFIPIFFIMVGVGFDLPALMESRSAVLLVPVLIGIAYAVKLGPALLFRVRYSWRDTLAAGVLLSSRLSLIIAASTIALQLGAITPAVNSAVILVAIATCILSPVIFSFLSPRSGVRDRVIVVGSHPAAALLARGLQEHHLDVLLVSNDPGVVAPLRELGIAVEPPGESELATLRAAAVERARSVVALDADEDLNLKICRAASHLGVPNVIAWVDDLARNAAFRRVGARVVNPSYSAMLIAESMVLSPGAFSISGNVDEVQEVRAVQLRNPDLIGQALGDVALAGEAMILTIMRGGNSIAPNPDTLLEARDTITVVGTKEAVTETVMRFALVRNGE